MSKTVHFSMSGKGFKFFDRKKLETSNFFITFDELLHSLYKKSQTVFNEAERSVWIFWLGSIKIGLAKIRFKVIGTPSGRNGQRSFPFRTEYCKPLNFIILLEKSISPLIPSTKTQPNWLNLYWRSILIYRAPFLNRYSERILTHCAQ